MIPYGRIYPHLATSFDWLENEGKGLPLGNGLMLRTLEQLVGLAHEQLLTTAAQKPVDRSRKNGAGTVQLPNARGMKGIKALGPHTGQSSALSPWAVRRGGPSGRKRLQRLHVREQTLGCYKMLFENARWSKLQTRVGTASGAQR